MNLSRSNIKETNTLLVYDLRRFSWRTFVFERFTKFRSATTFDLAAKSKQSIMWRNNREIYTYI